jgi:hypothetical protein
MDIELTPVVDDEEAHDVVVEDEAGFRPERRQCLPRGDLAELPMAPTGRACL